MVDERFGREESIRQSAAEFAEALDSATSAIEKMTSTLQRGTRSQAEKNKEEESELGRLRTRVRSVAFGAAGGFAGAVLGQGAIDVIRLGGGASTFGASVRTTIAGLGNRLLTGGDPAAQATQKIFQQLENAARFAPEGTNLSEQVGILADILLPQEERVNNFRQKVRDEIISRTDPGDGQGTGPAGKALASAIETLSEGLGQLIVAGRAIGDLLSKINLGGEGR